MPYEMAAMERPAPELSAIVAGHPSKLRRAGEIGRILANYGVDLVAGSGSAWSVVALPLKLIKKPKGKSQAERVRLALEELGPTYIKLGQAISTRPDLIPEEYAKELSKLQDHAPTIPYEQIAEVIKTEFGQPPEILFAKFDPNPIAAASLSQVHEAILPNGEVVVAKVQRPGIEITIEEDLGILRKIAHYLARSTESGKIHGVDEWFEEFEFTLRNELDFLRETRNTDQFTINFEADASVCLPKVYREYSTKRVLVIEKIDGIKITNLPALEEANIDRVGLSRVCALVLLKMVYEHGFFHADPHPGNFFVLRDGRLALIDSGMVGRLDTETRDSLMRLTLAVAQKNADRLTDELMGFAIAHRRVERSALKRNLDRLMQLHLEGPPEELSIAAMFNDSLEAAADHGLQLPSSITILARCFTMCEGIGAVLDPKFNFARFAEPYLRELYMKRYSRKGMMERAENEYVEIAEFGLTLPRSARRIMGQLERGELTVVSRLDDADTLMKTINQASNRLAMSMLTAGLIAGLSVLAIALKPAQLFGWGQALLIGMLVLVIGAGIALLGSIWRSK